MAIHGADLEKVDSRKPRPQWTKLIGHKAVVSRGNKKAASKVAPQRVFPKFATKAGDCLPKQRIETPKPLLAERSPSSTSQISGIQTTSEELGDNSVLRESSAPTNW